MLLLVQRHVSERVLTHYDAFLYLLRHVLHTDCSQTLGGAYFSSSLLLSILLCIYWSYAACLIVAADGGELTEWELNRLAQFLLF